MVKLMGCLILVAVGGAFGYLQAKKLSMRTNFFEEYQRFLSELQLQIRYYSGSLEQIIGKLAGYSLLTPLFQSCRQSLKDGKPFFEAWQNAVGKLPPDYGLMKSDQELMLELGRGLGVSDLEGQLSLCELNLQMAKIRFQESREAKIKKGRLYQMLGLSLGIGTALLFL